MEGQPRLVVAPISGAAIALGRFQRSRSSLSARGRSKRVVRRLTGGRALVLGQGLWGVALVLPHRSWLLSDAPDALPAASFLNRAVRGLLSGLTSLGCRANYFGRDFLTIDSGQAGYLSYELAGDGPALLECILPGASHWWLPDELSAHPAPPTDRAHPPPAQSEQLRSITAAQLLEAIGKGYVERFGVELERADSRIASAPFLVSDSPSLLWGPPTPIPIGFCEAGVRVEGDRLTAVSLRGDFLADAESVGRAEPGLLQVGLNREAITARLASIDGLLGVTPMELAEAVLSAVELSREIQALVTKYRRLLDLRLSRDAAAAVGRDAFPPEERLERRAQMRALAQQFPGALRELEELSADVLHARLEALERLPTSGASEPWMTITAFFHRVLREGLAMRSNAEARSSLWAGREADVRRPPNGRLLPLVWERVAQEYGLTATEAEQLVFPRG